MFFEIGRELLFLVSFAKKILHFNTMNVDKQRLMYEVIFRTHFCVTAGVVLNYPVDFIHKKEIIYI